MCWRDSLSNEEWWAQFQAERRIREALRAKPESQEEKMEGRERSRVPRDAAEALAHVQKFGLPDRIEAAFVLGGWVRKPTNEDEVVQLVTDGKNASPVGEATMYWKL